MNAIGTQNNFDKAQMITAHIAKLIGVAIRAPLIGLEKWESSTNPASISICCFTGLKNSSSSWALIFFASMCIVTDLSSVIVML